MIRAKEIRFVLVSDDYEAAVRLYQDVFALEVRMDLEDQDGRGVIFELPVATLELVDPAHERIVDEIEVGRAAPDHRFRIAVSVDALEEAAAEVMAAGAVAMVPAVKTPWGDHNQRFRIEDGSQLTLFQS
jgi:catechol 2,3-dioxygenase-like lactoylglutathione lyase family enzyme